jgi:hypothetical protein
LLTDFAISGYVCWALFPAEFARDDTDAVGEQQGALDPHAHAPPPLSRKPLLRFLRALRGHTTAHSRGNAQ